ncbi:hypothetical protein [Nocardia asteroides]|uniref:hypothetical protein n=1 Tax=Nocardia asteroides TaxID=1824 RepID=UPI001E3DFF67|nr:hypothetical protein [Nocardia asteroides]UGT58853.1 hypothetical protein LTT85_33415 [Nocardia asteroides]
MARRVPGVGKNSRWDPTFWCHKCNQCGRKGTRDFVPQFREDRRQWEERGSYASSLGVYGSAVVCRWTVACNRRYFAQVAAREAAEAAQRAGEAAAGIVTNTTPVDLDAVLDGTRPGAETPDAGGQLTFWDDPPTT